MVLSAGGRASHGLGRIRTRFPSISASISDPTQLGTVGMWHAMVLELDRGCESVLAYAGSI